MNSVRLPLKEALDGVLRRFGRMRWVHLVPDAIAIIICLLASALLRSDLAHAPWLDAVVKLLPAILLIRLATFVAMGVYDIIWRYISLRDVVAIGRAVFVSSLLVLATLFVLNQRSVPRSVFILSTVFLFVAMVGLRVLRRCLHEYPSLKRVQREGRRTLIYGAGTNGRTLAHRLHTDYDAGYQAVGFIDDDVRKLGRKIAGVTVLGVGPDLEAVLRATSAREVIVAISRPSGDALMKILNTCSKFNIKPRLIKKVAEPYQDGRKVEVLRDIDLTDLLNRGTRSIDLSSLMQLVPGKRVLVTGAGGSIGSELAKQIYGLGPARLLILDHSEFSLYEIDRELRGNSAASPVVPLLTDIKDRGALNQIFSEYRPEIVFHAAAYKHVHLVEANPMSAVLNNVLGTRNLLELSEESGVDAFILISTDKAVNPAGVMGMTKRVCELMVTDAGRRTGRRYASVRFGNVLGSSGSLIPLLKEQINQGKAITITHQDMHRYFMLIPEAVSLVLKAASMAKPGDIMVLSMGEPVRIVDLAKSLIALMGKSEAEVPIVYTGIRPGEKMQEELYLTGAEVGTADPDIMVIPRGDANRGDAWTSEHLGEHIDRIVEDARRHQHQAAERLARLVRGEIGETGISFLTKPVTVPPPESLSTH